MTPEALLAVWEDLLAGPPRPGGLDRRRVLPDAALDLFACGFWPGGQPGLLIEVDAGLQVRRERLPACSGLRFIHGAERRDGRGSLAVVLETAGLRDVFAVLAADLLAAAGAETTAKAGLRQCLDRIAMWRGLLEQLPPNGLGLEAQRGLFGELFVLQAVHLRALDGLAAVTSWDGPGRAWQDFNTDGLALEVKTSLAKRHARLTITSEKQLDDASLSALILAHVALDESVAGRSLPALVAQIRETLAGDQAALGEFNLRLMGAGYLDAHAPTYAETAYTVAALRTFEVRDAFPRLTGAQLPPGVGDVTYTIIADDLGAFEVDLAAVISRLGAVHG